MRDKIQKQKAIIVTVSFVIVYHCFSPFYHLFPIFRFVSLVNHSSLSFAAIVCIAGQNNKSLCTHTHFYRGTLGAPGSSLFMFEHKAVIRVPREEVLQSAYSDPLELAIEVGAEDVIMSSSSDEGGSDSEDDCFQFKCEPSEMKSVSDAVTKMGLTLSSSTLEYIPKSCVPLEEKLYNKAIRLVDLLTENPDVMEVYDNFTLQTSGV